MIVISVADTDTDHLKDSPQSPKGFPDGGQEGAGDTKCLEDTIGEIKPLHLEVALVDPAPGYEPICGRKYIRFNRLTAHKGAGPRDIEVSNIIIELVSHGYSSSWSQSPDTDGVSKGYQHISSHVGL